MGVPPELVGCSKEYDTSGEGRLFLDEGDAECGRIVGVMALQETVGCAAPTGVQPCPL
jgi:hypothetical protein